MDFGEQVEALQLAYESGEPLSFIETQSGNQLSNVSVENIDSESVDDVSVERLVGEDGAGVPVAFDIQYTDGNIESVIVRRGLSQTEYGELSEVVIG